MRKSSRGNPWHDKEGKFCHGPEATIDTWGNPITDEQRNESVLSSEQTEEYYRARTGYRNGDITEAEMGSFEKSPPKPRQNEKPPFVPAKTRKEAEEFTRSLGVRPYFKGLDIDTCNACNQALYETITEYPEVANYVKVIGSGQEINKELKARLKPIIQEEFQLKYAGQFPQSAIDRGVKKQVNKYATNMRGYAYFTRKVVSVSGEKSEIASEYGGIYLHVKNMSNANAVKEAYERDVSHKFHPEGTAGNSVKAIIDHEFGHAIDYAYEISEKVDTHKKTEDDIVNGLSVYATANKREYIAEAWCEYRNSKTPREIATEVGSIIEGARA